MNILFFDVIVIDLYSPYCIHLTVSVQRFKDDRKSLKLLQYSEKRYDIAYHVAINKTAQLETPSVMTVDNLSMSQHLYFWNTVFGIKALVDIRH